MIEGITHSTAALLKTSPDAAFTAGKKPAQEKGDNAKVALPAAAPLNPRLRYDATSGTVITEFLDQSGSVQTQSPSNAVLAYLRAGLSKDGLSEAVEKEAKDVQESTLDA